MRRLVEWFKSDRGLELYAQFGTLLGIVREGDFIAGDHDVDCCYLSRHTDRREVLKEQLELYHHLQEFGMLRKSWRAGQAFVWQGGSLVVDVFTSWVDEQGFYYTSQWGSFGKAERFFPLTTGRLRGVEIPVPRNAEVLLARLYGPDWRTPAPSHPSDRLRRGRHLLG